MNCVRGPARPGPTGRAIAPSTGCSRPLARTALNNDQALQRFWRDKAHTAGRVHAANDAERAYVMFGNQVRAPTRRHDGLRQTGRMTSFIREAESQQGHHLRVHIPIRRSRFERPGHATALPRGRRGQRPDGRCCCTAAVRRRVGRTSAEYRRSRSAFPRHRRGSAGYGHSDKHTEHEQYNRYSATPCSPVRPSRCRTCRPGRQFARWRRTAVRFALDNPGPRRAAGADGTRRVERQPVRARSHPRESSCWAGSPPIRRGRTWNGSYGSWSRPEVDHSELVDERFAIASQPESLAAARAMGKSRSPDRTTNSA